MPRPKGDEWLEDELKRLRNQNVDVIVSLLERHEINELGLQTQPQLCKANNIEYLSFPIPDRNIPRNEAEAERFIKLLVQKLEEKTNIAIHCRMGIGRSAIIAGGVLLHCGYKVDEIIPHISKMRGLSVPDTEEQARWLKKLSR
jgi:protein-tyrosine phosphatase